MLEVNNLSISFTQYEKWFSRKELQVIRNLNITVRAGEITAVIGSSGSGKSLLAHGILGILPYNASLEGSMIYKGEALTEERQKALRGREIVLVPQSVSYLDPLMKVGAQVRNGRKDRASKDRERDILKRYGLGRDTEHLYPFELSGGMARRILISTAVMERPGLVIADEPTPGLHIEAARRVLGHFREIADDGAGVLLITHDLELALDVADSIAVLYAGTTIEEASAEDFMTEETLRHPYTRALYRAMPKNGFIAEPGTQPYAGEIAGGCPYRPRCPFAKEACGGEIPWLFVNGGHVRCIEDIRKAGERR
ncbi:ABC transporter ATP-binding protein [Clostridium sp. AM58-1XD]|nr:ABC transporter ATP-binding protein [Clostridium sp. AM58-1XD]